MGKIRFVLQNIFLIVGVIASALLLENVGFLTHDASGHLPDSYFFILFALAIFSYFATYFFEHKNNKLKVDWLLLLCCIVLFASGVVAIFTFKTTSFIGKKGTFVVEYTDLEKYKMLMATFVFAITIYSLFFVFSKNVISFRKLWVVYLILILVGYFVCVYSLVAEKEIYHEIFEHRGDVSKDVQSVFNNPNMFGGTLVMCSIACILLNLVKRNPLSYISLFFFCIMALFIKSVMSLTAVICLFFVYFIVELIAGIKRRPGIYTFLLLLYVMFIVSAVLVFVFALTKNFGPISSLAHFVEKVYHSAKYSTFSGRIDLWTKAYDLLKEEPLKLAFGFGYRISTDVFNAAIASIGGDVASVHSGPVQIFFNFGIVGTCIFGLFVFYFIYSGIRLIKQKTRFSLVYLFVGFVMFGYSVGESVFPFNFNVQGLLVGTLFYLPLMMTMQHQRRGQIKEEIEKSEIHKSDKQSILSVLAIIMLVALFAVVPLFAIEDIYSIPLFLNIVICVIVGLVLILLTVPTLVSLWIDRGGKTHLVIRFIFNFLFIVGTCVTCGYFVYKKCGTDLCYLLITPACYVGCYLLELFIYKVCCRFSAKGCFKTIAFTLFSNLIPICIGLTICTIAYLFLDKYFIYGNLIYILVPVIDALIIYFMMLLFNSKSIKKVSETMLNNFTCRTKRHLLKESRGK